jgi:hypothetical protein
VDSPAASGIMFDMVEELAVAMLEQPGAKYVTVATDAELFATPGVSKTDSSNVRVQLLLEYPPNGL